MICERESKKKIKVLKKKYERMMMFIDYASIVEDYTKVNKVELR